jgi:hypothetical protein
MFSIKNLRADHFFKALAWYFLSEKKILEEHFEKWIEPHYQNGALKDEGKKKHIWTSKTQALQQICGLGSDLLLEPPHVPFQLGFTQTMGSLLINI